jgi:hypothetical protein
MVELVLFETIWTMDHFAFRVVQLDAYSFHGKSGKCCHYKPPENHERIQNGVFKIMERV